LVVAAYCTPLHQALIWVPAGTFAPFNLTVPHGLKGKGGGVCACARPARISMQGNAKARAFGIRRDIR
jgi:hypothetical protein